MNIGTLQQIALTRDPNALFGLADLVVVTRQELDKCRFVLGTDHPRKLNFKCRRHCASGRDLAKTQIVS